MASEIGVRNEYAHDQKNRYHYALHHGHLAVFDPVANAMTKGEIDASVKAAMTRSTKDIKGGNKR